MGVVLGGRYRIIRPLGKGGAGHVYVAMQEQLGREVAIKVLRTDISELARAEFEARFHREAAMAGRLHHPNVLTVFDYGTERDGMHYLVTELLQGRTLGKRLRDEGAIDPYEVARLGALLARGLRAAHQEGLVHRDIKTGNIFLERGEDGVESPKILDFGLVKVADGSDSSLTQVGTYMGTPAYMSPEQARGDGNMDHRADLYSLGCVLYRCATGRMPFEADSPLTLAMKHATSPVPPMSDSGREVPAELEAMVRKCLEKEPAARWSSGSELARALEEFAGIARLPTASIPRPKRRFGRVVAVAFVAAGLAAATFALVLGIGLVAGAKLLVPAESHADPVPEPALFVSEPTSPEVDPGSVSPEPEPALVLPEPALSAPAPAPAPAAAAAPVAPTPAPVAAPAPSKRPAPKPTPAPTEVAQTLDGIPFDAAEATAALAFVNSASEADIRAAGVYGRAVNIIVDGRPFPSLKAFADTPYIGEKTVLAVKAAASPPR